jgi:hypothetical protein
MKTSVLTLAGFYSFFGLDIPCLPRSLIPPFASQGNYDKSMDPAMLLPNAFTK